MFKEGGEEKKKKKKVGFVTLSRRVNTVPGQIYRGYLWSSWNEPMGLKGPDSKVSIVQWNESDGSNTQTRSSGLRSFRFKSIHF